MENELPVDSERSAQEQTAQEKTTEEQSAQQLNPYDMMGSEAGVRRLAKAFYAAMDRLPEAAGIRAMHKDDLSAIEEKLADYLITWLGGPPIYIEKNGGMCLTDAHAPFAIGPAERDQWLLCMNTALEDIGASAEIRDIVREPFQRLADFIRTRD